jgi:adenylate cyclase
MSKSSLWKLPAKKRGWVLSLTALVVAFPLAVVHYLGDVRSEEKTGILNEGILALDGLLDSWEWRNYDRVQLNGVKAPPDPDIVVLGIDDASLDVQNSSALPEEIENSRPLQLMIGWPWSREVYAHVLDRLFTAGARTVVIDLIFPGPSNGAPEGDPVFAKTLEKYKGRVVLGADFVTSASGGQESDSLSLPWEGLIPRTWPADERVGFVTFPSDADGIIRRAQFFRSDTGEPERGLPSLAASVLRLQGKPDIIPIDQPDYLFRFSDPRAYMHFPLHEIFIPDIWESNFGGGSFFQGKTVFIGPAARQQQDSKETPVGTLLGVQVHAHALAALKRGLFLRQISIGWRVALILILTAAAAFLVFYWRRPMACLLMLFGGIALGAVFQVLAFNHLSIVLPMAVPLLGWGLTGFTGLTFDFMMERKQKQAFLRAITRYFSPDMSAEILRDPDDYYKALEGASRTITLLFSDVRGFTSMSETAEPKALVSQLNEYLQSMVDIVFRHRGSIDKFIGDAVMAVWGRLRNEGSEDALNQDALAGVGAAVDMREELVRLNQDWVSRGMEPLAFGIGVHQGDAIVGDIGSNERKEFTAIGDSVNSSARLESATKQYGVDLLISDAVRHRVSDHFICRAADLVRVKGKAKPLEIFTVVGKISDPCPPALEFYEQAVRLFRAGQFHDSLAELTKAQSGGLDDSLTHLYQERCHELIAHPPETWDGVWTMTKK